MPAKPNHAIGLSAIPLSTPKADDDVPASLGGSLKDVARRNGVSVRTLYREVAEGKLIVTKIRGRSVVTREA